MSLSDRAESIKQAQQAFEDTKKKKFLIPKEVEDRLTVFEKLKDPFPQNIVSWKPQKTGLNSRGKAYVMIVAYVDARDVMNRLDDAVGPQNWKDDYLRTDQGFLCKLSIRIGEEWVTKQDWGADSGQADQQKGGISDAFKRCAVKWGVARYLYKWDVEFAEMSGERKDNWNYIKIDNQPFWWRKKPIQ